MVHQTLAKVKETKWHLTLSQDGLKSRTSRRGKESEKEYNIIIKYWDRRRRRKVNSCSTQPEDKTHYKGVLKAHGRQIGFKLPSFNKSLDWAFHLLYKSPANTGMEKAEQTLMVCLQVRAIVVYKTSVLKIVFCISEKGFQWQRVSWIWPLTHSITPKLIFIGFVWIDILCAL